MPKPIAILAALASLAFTGLALASPAHAQGETTPEILPETPGEITPTFPDPLTTPPEIMDPCDLPPDDETTRSEHREECGEEEPPAEAPSGERPSEPPPTDPPPAPTTPAPPDADRG